MQPILTLKSAADRAGYLVEEGSRRKMIAIAGLPGSGKSTFAARLARRVNELLSENVVTVLGMDGFHLSRRALLEMENPDALFARRGAPWTFDVAKFAERVQRIREASPPADVSDPVPWPDFEHNIGDPVEGAIQVSGASKLILVEGLYLLLGSNGWEDANRLFDERWYLDTPMVVSMSRLVHRHIKAWGISQPEAEARVAQNDRLNAEIVLASRDSADCFVLA